MENNPKTPALPDDVPGGARTDDRASREDSGKNTKGNAPVGDPVGWSSITDQDLDDIFGYEGPDGWVDPKIELPVEQRALIDSVPPDDPIKAILDGTDGTSKPPPISAVDDSQVTYPEGWWVPEERSWEMAVRGGPEMTASEYGSAFLDKLVGLIESEGKEQAKAMILAFFDPYNREEYFDMNADLRTWAEAIVDLLAFPQASPENSAPATADEAQRAVDAQDELSLSEVLSAGVA